jgi:tetrathionate reductase subunit A
MKVDRRHLIAAGGLAAFAAGFSRTLGRMAEAAVGEDAPADRFYGQAPEPEYRVDPVTGELALNPAQQVSYTGCLGCTTQCGVRVRVDKASGRILRVTGNPYSPLSADPPLPMKASVKESFVALSRFGDKGLDGRATACGRGNAVLAQIDSPFRVLTPLKRVGPRNGGQWQPIAFEQLVKEVVAGGDLFGEGHVDGLRALRDLKTPIDPARPELGPVANQVALMTSVNDGRDSLGQRFIKQAFGSVNFVRHGSYCGGSYRSGSGAVFGDLKKMPHGKPDLENAEFVLFIGTAPGHAGNPFKRTAALLAKARSEGGLDYVVVDPVLTHADSLAAGERARWVPIRPGTDSALVMGMIRWMIENGRVNRAYLAHPNLAQAEAAGEPSFSNAGWLVVTEPGHPREGRHLRASDLGLAPEGVSAYDEADPHLILAADGRPVPAESAAIDAWLDAEVTLVDATGQPVAVKSGYRLLEAAALSLSLDDYARECGIPAQTIAALAGAFTAHGRKAAAVAHGGMMSGAGFYSAFGVITLNVLIGNVNWKGGFAFTGGAFKDAGKGPRYDLAGFEGQVKPKGMPLGRNAPYEKTSEFKRKQAEGKAYPANRPWVPTAPGLATQWFTGAMEGDPYALKALILWSANPVYGIPGLRRQLEADLADPKRLPLFIAVDPLINESNAFADYIVPDSLLYESWGWTAPWNGVPTRTTTARWPVIEPRMDKTADGQPIGIEAFLIAVADALGLPGFGDDAIADAEGHLHPLKRAEDWFLRGGANIAFAGKAPVDEATDEDMRLSGVDRIRERLEATLKPDEWRRVAAVYTRGGRYQSASQAQDAEHPEWMAARFKAPLMVWNEAVGGARNSLTGKRHSGCARFHPPAFFDGTPMRQVHGEDEWPLQIVSFKSALQNSYSIATRVTGIHPSNPVIVHPDDAARLHLETGQAVWLETPGGRVSTTVIVHAGVMPGVVGVEHGYGHKELGARAHQIGANRQPVREALKAGINLNDLGISDPTVPGRSVWIDSVSGAVVRNGLPARLVRA